MLKLRTFFISVSFFLMCHFSAFTQDADLKQKFAQAQQQNKAAITQFAWKSRTELKVKEETKKVKVEQVRYGADGNLQKITLEESSPEPQQQAGGRRNGRLKQKIVENKKEEFKELMQQLVVLAQAYGDIPPDAMKAFLQNASFSPGKGPAQGSIVITGTGALNPSDRMSIWIVKETLLVKRVEIHTLLDKHPVNLTTEYLQLTGGPSVQSRSTLEYPEKKIFVSIDNFDHQKL